VVCCARASDFLVGVATRTAHDTGTDTGVPKEWSERMDNQEMYNCIEFFSTWLALRC
jgi:hypothetical protein